MDALALERLDQDQGWRTLLATYANAPEPAGEEPTDEEREGWLPRVDDLDGVEPDRLPRLHGRLIAFGLIEFQLTSMTTGVVYRATRTGRDWLKGGEDEDALAA